MKTLITLLFSKKHYLINFGSCEGDIPFGLSDYLALVGSTGRAILERLNLNYNTWFDELNQFKSIGHTAVETIQQLKDFCKSVKNKWRTFIQLIPALE